jgi:predicted nucleic acid-binding protein
LIVYVESNFILEIALQQEQAAGAEALLGLAEVGRISMRWPAFCLAESLGTLMRRGNARQSVQSQILQQAKDLGRSDAHTSLAEKLRGVSQELVAIEALESSRFDCVVKRLLSLGGPVPLDAETHQDALKYRAKYGLSIQDAVVYACVVADLRQRDRRERKLFLSRNSKDFGADDLTAELAALACIYMASFDQALQAASAS